MLIADEPTQLGAAGVTGERRDQAAQLRAFLQEGDPVTAKRGYPSGLKAGRAAADHEDALAHGRRLDRHLLFPTGGGVDRADDRPARVVAFVAGNAAPQLLDSAG